MAASGMEKALARWVTSGAFSFQSSKLITSGEGGAVITNNLEYLERVQSYINAGRASLTDQFHHRIIGFNYRLGEFQAAVLCPQLERLPEQAALRKKNMLHFESRLHNTRASVVLKPESRITQQAPYGYVLKYFQIRQSGIPRAEFVAALQTEGIPCDGLFYEPVYKSSLFPLDPTDFPALSWGREKPSISGICIPARKPIAPLIRKPYGFPISFSSAAFQDVDAIAVAIHKVLSNIEELRGLDHKAIRNQRLGRADRES